MLAETQLAPQASLISTPTSSITLAAEYRRQRNNNGDDELQSTGTLAGTPPSSQTPGSSSYASKHGLQIWHYTPGQYIECTCKLTTTMQQGKTITWHKLTYISGLTCEQQYHISIRSSNILTEHSRSSCIMI